MSLLFFDPKENLLPFDGVVNDLGIILNNTGQIYHELLKTLLWQSDQITLFGKTYITERQFVWMGDNGLTYQYSGHKRVSSPWAEEVLRLKTQVEQKLLEQDIKIQFNSCLLNYYPTGSSGMGYHTDNEKELGDNPIIASLSIGTSRKFVLKHNQTKQKIAIWLESGHLIIMRGETQTYWKHTLTKSENITEGRINLTFRKIVI